MNKNIVCNKFLIFLDSEYQNYLIERLYIKINFREYNFLLFKGSKSHDIY